MLNKEESAVLVIEAREALSMRIMDMLEVYKDELSIDMDLAKTAPEYRTKMAAKCLAWFVNNVK